MISRGQRGFRTVVGAILLVVSAATGAAENPWYTDRHAPGAAPPLLLASAPPAEFEEMLRPQRTVVDVYFGSERLGTALAEYTPETIEFVAPEEVVNRIPNVVSRNALVNHLSGPQPRNSDLVCRSQSQPDCGKLTPDFIGVIFDESHFRVDVFVHPDMLMVAPATVTRNLPGPGNPGYSLVQNINAVMSESTGEQHHTIAGLTYVAKDMQRVYSRWTSTETDSFQASELAWQRDTHDFEYTAGVFQSHADALSFAHSEYLAGGGFGRSLKTRTDLDYAQGTEIQLFLTSRSQVDIYKDGKLVSTKIYSAGNVNLDTSRLPSGAYDIEIRIREIDGTVRTLTRFFVKTNLLAPKGESLYYLEGGQIVHAVSGEAFPQSENAFELRGGYQRRLTDDLGFNAGGALTDTHALAEGGLMFMRPTWQLGTEAGITTQGDYGFGTSAQARLGKYSVGMYYRGTRASDQSRAASHYQLIASDDQHASVSLAMPLYQGQLQLGVEHDRNSAGDTEAYTSRYMQPLPLFRTMNANLAAELSHVDGGLFAQIGISFTQSAEHLTWGGGLGAAHESGSGNDRSVATGNAILTWRSGQLRPEDIEATLRASHDIDTTVAGVDGLYASQFGRAEATAENVRTDIGTSGNRLSASYDTNLVANGSGVSFGGRELAPSAVVLDLGKDDSGAEFDVLINGQKATSIRSGHRVVVPLAAYRAYSIQLVDRGLAFVAFDAGVRKVTLYPGTVQTLSWDIRPVQVAVGRFVLHQQLCSHTDGSCHDIRLPLKNAMIEGAWGFAMTDDDGRFQIEMLKGTAALTLKRKTYTCTAPVQPQGVVNGIVKLGELDCADNPDAAPAAEPAPATEPAPAAPVENPPADTTPGTDAPGATAAAPSTPATESSPSP